MFVKALSVLFLVVLVAAVITRQSSGSGPSTPYVVRPHDTLWSISVAHYAGDPREGVWKLEQRNHVQDGLIRPGQRLVLP